MVRSNQQAQSESKRERAHTARKGKARILIEQSNRHSGEAVKDLPQVEQKAERNIQKQDIISSRKEAAYRSNKDSRSNRAEAKNTVKMHMEQDTARLERKRLDTQPPDMQTLGRQIHHLHRRLRGARRQQPGGRL